MALNRPELKQNRKILLLKRNRAPSETPCIIYGIQNPQFRFLGIPQRDDLSDGGFLQPRGRQTASHGYTGGLILRG